MKSYKNLFNKKVRKEPEDDYVTIISQDGVVVKHPKNEAEEILWKEIEQIKLIKNEAGPWSPDIWLALIGEKSACFIPHGSEGFDKVYEIISKYHNFNFENFTKSMTCTVNQEFVLWENKIKQ
jgi:hypothetical protein